MTSTRPSDSNPSLCALMDSQKISVVFYFSFWDAFEYTYIELTSTFPQDHFRSHNAQETNRVTCPDPAKACLHERRHMWPGSPRIGMYKYPLTSLNYPEELRNLSNPNYPGKTMHSNKIISVPRNKNLLITRKGYCRPFC